MLFIDGAVFGGESAEKWFRTVPLQQQPPKDWQMSTT
jgi:hypothetical protein